MCVHVYVGEGGGGGEGLFTTSASDYILVVAGHLFNVCTVNGDQTEP